MIKGSAAMQPQTRTLWGRTTLHVAAEKYYLVSLPMTMLSEAASLVAKEAGSFAALIVEPDEVSLTIRDSAWRTSPLRRRAIAESRLFRAITFNLDLSLTVIGYLAPAARRLAAGRHFHRSSMCISERPLIGSRSRSGKGNGGPRETNSRLQEAARAAVRCGSVARRLLKNS